MINFNGKLTEQYQLISTLNRGYTYGDSVFETIKVANGKILFLEDHYFRLMASMRIMRIEIPMTFTLEFIESEIKQTLNVNNLENSSARIKLQVNRAEGGLYLPTSKDIDYIISASALSNDLYNINTTNYLVDLFKDYYISPSLLSTLKTNNKAINVVGSIFANENDFDNCLLLNTNKSVVEALNGNIFLRSGNTVKTPPLSDGCLKGIMRKQIIDIIEKSPDYDIQETSISPFEIQKADELFITNVISGVVCVTQYRKKLFNNDLAKQLIDKLNIKIRLS